MNNSINLLYKKNNYKKKDQILSIVRKATLIFGVITLFIVFGVYYLTSMVNKTYKTLAAQKEQLLAELAPQKDKIRLITTLYEKGSYASSIANTDPRFDTYMTMLQQLVPASTQSAVINSFSIDSKKKLATSISFSSMSDVFQFLDAIENKEFLNIFSSLSVNSIAFVGNKQPDSKITISLTGSVNNLEIPKNP